MKTIKGKVVVITGGSTGIGHELVKVFAKEGASIATCDIASLDNTKNAISNYNIEQYYEKVDMADKKAIKKFADNVLKKFGHIDILINNAGIALGDVSFDKVSLEDFEKITNINYWGVIYTTQLFYPTLLERPEAALVNLSSSQGILALPYLVPYCTTKFAVRGFTDSLRIENEVRGIKNISIHTVHPGRVATNITMNADYKSKRSQRFHDDLQAGTSAAAAAKIILKGIKQKKDRIFISDGELHDILARVMPASNKYVVKQMMKLKNFAFD
ncbi:MAG: SDR family NAD(P)-dependent oxidoreductase [Sphingobacteriales bacterium]|jgi:NAD(P)-dependent dehydrogenase (short-subunit alcohol dehydrogenase family)|nr:MAG: SDR family NAD(P)-dependent oxidoreductase [Sphingobacteriales bacterium]